MPAHFHRPTSNHCVGIVFTRREINSNPNLQFIPNQHREPNSTHLKASEMRFIPGYIIPTMMRGIWTVRRQNMARYGLSRSFTNVEMLLTSLWYITHRQLIRTLTNLTLSSRASNGYILCWCIVFTTKYNSFIIPSRTEIIFLATLLASDKSLQRL